MGVLSPGSLPSHVSIPTQQAQNPSGPHLAFQEAGLQGQHQPRAQRPTSSGASVSLTVK